MRLAVALTFPVHPPLGGGQVRAYNLYRELAKEFEIELVTLAPAGTRRSRTQLAPGLWEHRVPKSSTHAAEEAALEREAGTLITDVAMPQLYHHTPDYLAALRDATRGALAAIACHPFTFPAIREVTDVPVWYEAQDVEALLKADVLGNSETARGLLAEVERVERECCQRAELVWACSAEDREELIRRYGTDGDRVLVVPNGLALDDLSYVAPRARRENKRRLRLGGRFLAVFIASWHGPNVTGAHRLLKVADQQTAVDFLILGSVGMALSERRLPRNVELTGVISSEFKAAVLSVADVALNPVTTGSGTNIKMLDYFGAGTPVISTGFGARGLGVRAGEHYFEAEPAAFDAALATVREFDAADLTAVVEAARTHVETSLSWTVIADELLGALGSGAGSVSHSA